MISVTEVCLEWHPDMPCSGGFVPSVTKVYPDFTGLKIAGRVLTRCPPSSVVERVLGKNEVTGSIPVGGSEWKARVRVDSREKPTQTRAFHIRGGVAQLVRAHDS